MSEAWHQHLQNLSWWEQIDRFFNPGKYSCSTVHFGDFYWHVFLGIIFGTVILTVVIIWLTRHEAKKVFKELAFNTPKESCVECW